MSSAGDHFLGNHSVPAMLEGGSADIPEDLRVCQARAEDVKIKVPHRGGYEHFERVHVKPEAGTPAVPVVFRWTTQTKVAE